MVRVFIEVAWHYPNIFVDLNWNDFFFHLWNIWILANKKFWIFLVCIGDRNLVDYLIRL